MFVGLPFLIDRSRQPAGEVLRHSLLEMKEKGRGLGSGYILSLGQN